MAEVSRVEQFFRNWNNGVHDWAAFVSAVPESPCMKSQVLALYKIGYPHDENKQVAPRIAKLREGIKAVATTEVKAGKIKINNIGIKSRSNVYSSINEDIVENVYSAADWVRRNRRQEAENIVTRCAAAYTASTKSDKANTSKDTEENKVIAADTNKTRPFDRRLDRLEEYTFKSETEQSTQKPTRYVPFSSDFAELSTTGYLISQKTLRTSFENSPDSLKEKLIKVQDEYDQMAKNEFYQGVPALQNYYALIRLYKSDGGKTLVNQKNQRRWYEVDSTTTKDVNFASTPTTSALISWGEGDPYGRTPYQFTDFVFSKYWNKIANNRLITLRRYAAPILDNLKFPGMINQPNVQNSEKGTTTSTTADDAGSTKSESIAFPPMATAVTYFGGESGNSLNSIIRFSTGMPWEEIQANVWNVTTDTVPSNESGPGSLYKGISKLGEMLNVAGGNFDQNLIMNKGMLPPDPYEDGPYENRIRGPLNRIDKIKKRTPGIDFAWDGLNIVFEYVARPVGGINPKAVLLDIMSNFLVMGSASAVFFGGAHRFMSNPAKYPFLGGEEGIEKWYKGDPIGWGLSTIKQFTQGGAQANKGGSVESVATNLFKDIQGFFSNLFSGEKGSIFGSVTSLFTGGLGNIAKNEIAKRTDGQIPYLQGMKAILTGEPVGEWHVTVGNPLNPIAMIGNLICKGIEVEWNEELGPDDFPTEIKITVKLEHAMARDRDAIESIFNRGMRRIYNLPDTLSGSADYQTKVDNATQQPTKTGTMPNRRMGIMYKPGMDSGFIPPSQLEGKSSALGGEVSVWNRAAFNLGISENSATQFITNENDIYLTAYRSADWIAQRSLT